MVRLEEKKVKEKKNKGKQTQIRMSFPLFDLIESERKAKRIVDFMRQKF